MKHELRIKSFKPNLIDNEPKDGRTDLTEEMIYTIDGDDTKDFDDAVSVKKLENGFVLKFLVSLCITSLSNAKFVLVN